MATLLRRLLWPFRVVEIVRLGLSGKHDHHRPQRDEAQTSRVHTAADEELAQLAQRRPHDDPDLRANRATLHRLERETNRQLRMAGIQSERDAQLEETRHRLKFELKVQGGTSTWEE